MGFQTQPTVKFDPRLKIQNSVLFSIPENTVRAFSCVIIKYE